jgi:hypothetical protein
MTFMGVDSSDGLEADFDSNLDSGDAPFQLFSLRNLINFLLGFSWSGIALFDTIPNTAFLIFVSFTIGVSFIYGFFLIIKQILKLGEDNSFQYEMAIGKLADVYLRIPGKMSGKGKVMISVNGSSRELSAMTQDEDEIPSGLVVRIKQADGDVLIVEKV